MAAEALAQHPPALKVGGRRLSVTSRPKPHSPSEAKAPSPGPEPADYPRPAAPDEQHPLHNEEEAPKKEKKGKGGNEHERRLQENLLRKAEQNRPSKETHNAKNRNAIGGGGRISQPAGHPMM